MAVILVAEDDTLTRDFIATGLRRAGYEVVEAANGREACEKIDQSKPDAAILDLFMPLKSGIEVARHLHREKAGIPIIGITGISGTESSRAIAEALSLGARKVLRKPFTMDELLHSTLEIAG